MSDFKGNDPTEMEDAVLVKRLLKDDHEAFAVLYHRYWKKLYEAACLKISDPMVCEGIVQDLFTNIWRRRNALALQKSFGAYIFTALRYMILNHYDALKVRRKYLEELDPKSLNIDDSTQQLIDYQELFETIEAEVSKLPEKCQQVFRLSRQQHLSAKQVADTLGISTKTVENHLTKALKTLRTHLNESSVSLLLLLDILG